MLSKNQLKFFSSLKQKKSRKENKLFLIEGEKIVTELLGQSGFLSIRTLLATEDFLKNLNAPLPEEVIPVSKKELDRLSALSSPANAILIADSPEYSIKKDELRNTFSFAYEDIRDPGNLGTIIRTCDWFGIHTIFLSNESVELFNPKVIQASMGSIARVKVHYMDLTELLLTKPFADPDFQKIATSLSGNNILTEKQKKQGIVFFGNESKGLSEQIIKKCDSVWFIPGGSATPGAESLNLGISTGITGFVVTHKAVIRNENSA